MTCQTEKASVSECDVFEELLSIIESVSALRSDPLESWYVLWRRGDFFKAAESKSLIKRYS